MTPLLFLVLALAGGLGSMCRLLLDGIIRSRSRGTMPWGTITINLTGSFALGLAVSLAAGQVLPEAWELVIGPGFLGGYTTFSTASFETIRLLQERKRLASILNGLGVVITATAAAGLGMWIGSLA